MKASRYNFFFKVDDQTNLAYNSRTGVLAKLQQQEFDDLQQFCVDPQVDFFTSRGLETYCQELVKTGFLVPDEMDELEYLRLTHKALKERQEVIGLAIIPTLDCNFRCVYCFSYSRKQRMSPTVQQDLLHFIETRLPGSAGLSITWYGGEPTLCLPIIESLSQQMKVLCERTQVHFKPASIITNGFLLTEKVARRLKATGIEEAQVTLDGDAFTHNQRRPLRDGGETFDRILENLPAASQILKLQVRINIDRTNAKASVAALDALASHGLTKIPVYFGHVQPFTKACAGVASDCFNDQEFAEANLALTRSALARGFTSFTYPRLALGGVCIGENNQGYVVAPDGLLYKCYAQASLGVEQSVGNVCEDLVTPGQGSNKRRFLDWDLFSNSDCRYCRLLPICMGGCPYLRQYGKPGANCATWRYSLQGTLTLRYEIKQHIEKQALEIHAI